MRLQSYAIDEQGNYQWNKLLRNVKPFYLVPRNADQNAAQPEQVVVPANGQSNDVRMTVNHEGPFEGAYLTYDVGATGVAAAQLIELEMPSVKHKITGRPCHISTVMGSGQRYNILPESIWLQKRQGLIFRSFDLSGQENTVRPVIHGQRFWLDQARDANLDKYARERDFRNRYILPYMCPTDEDITMDASQAATDYYFTQDVRGHFEVFKICVHSTDEFKFVILDENDQQLMTNWVHVNAGMGNAQDPFVFYGTWLISAGGQCTFRLQELSGDENKIYITLIGRMLMV